MSAALDHGALSKPEAEALTERISQGLTDVHELIVRAWEGRAWQALGFPSWDAWIDENFRGLQLRPPREQREEVVQSMREAGMSVRAIAQATDLSYGTVHGAALAGDQKRSPDEGPSNVIGLDGKRYSRPNREAPAADESAEPGAVSLDELGILPIDPRSLGTGKPEVLTGEVIEPDEESSKPRRLRRVEDSSPAPESASEPETEDAVVDTSWWEGPRAALLEAEARCVELLRSRKDQPRLVEDPQDPGPSELTMTAARAVLAAGGVIVDCGVEDLDKDAQEALRKVLSTVVTSLDGVIGDLEVADDER